MHGKTTFSIKTMFKFEQKPTEKTDYIVGSTWSSLQKSWKEYKKAKEEANVLRMKQYGRKIQNLQKKLGLKESTFPELTERPDPSYK